ncbi:hypothetical protein C1645_742211 [Glomus cerebriforme]|uniref:NYN domain-containing protein n=1 Tax=Glomus cerebriforme TaxID=658196 RepID=A0A397SEC2_9GLOM|nr:hypothetical protein C1645_742211 [Glomus cerebriforme]
MASINCLLLGKTSFGDAFPFNIGKINYVRNTGIVISKLKIEDLKFLIWDHIRKEVKVYSYYSMNLWKVDIKKEDENKLKDVFTEDDIKLKLEGNKLIPADLFINLFKQDEFDINIENIHIIVDVQQPSTTGQTDLVHIFIDNSKFFNQGGAAIRRHEGMNYKCEYNHITYDYGLLIKKLRGDREFGCEPLIVGYNPSSADSIWDKIKNEGYDIKVFNKKNIKVDNYLTLKMCKAIYQTNPGILVLVASDGDYNDVILEAFNYKWKIEIWCWNLGIKSCLFECSNFVTQHLHPTPRLHDKFKNSENITFITFDAYYKSFAYGYGAYSTDRIQRLDINNGNTIRNREIWKLFANNNLFFWFYREDKTIHLYFNTREKLNRTKNLLENEFKKLEIREKNY